MKEKPSGGIEAPSAETEVAAASEAVAKAVAWR